ncbi:MAG TPA: hypothetical protein VG328_25860 [Stellaceae bacterium]|jgi:photosystem II stability/assembly factor-like uncharacterized protein|nr:hypothetical protein [Stellaceae bacterium]
MTICLSTNGQIVFDEPGPPIRLIVATLNGAQILERDRPGAAWRRVGLALSGKHVSALLVAPDQRDIFAGVHDGGLYYSGDDGQSWERRTAGIGIEHVFSLAAVRDTEGVAIYAGTEPVSLFRSRDSGRSWRELPAIRQVPGTETWIFPAPPHSAHTKALAIDPRDPSHIYVAVEQGALLVSHDSGAHWRVLDSYDRPDDLWHHDIHRVVLRPSNPDEIFMTTGNGLYHSVDAGRSWEHVTDVHFRIGYPDHLVFAPGDETTLFLSGAENDPTIWRRTKHAGGTVFRSRDNGRSWARAANGLTDGHANIEAMCVVGYPGGYSLFVGTTDGEVYTSDDDAENWTRIAENLSPISKGAHYRLVTEPLHASVPT